MSLVWWQQLWILFQINCEIWGVGYHVIPSDPSRWRLHFVITFSELAVIRGRQDAYFWGNVPISLSYYYGWSKHWFTCLLSMAIIYQEVEWYSIREKGFFHWRFEIQPESVLVCTETDVDTCLSFFETSSTCSNECLSVINCFNHSSSSHYIPGQTTPQYTQSSVSETSGPLPICQVLLPYVQSSLTKLMSLPTWKKWYTDKHHLIPGIQPDACSVDTYFPHCAETPQFAFSNCDYNVSRGHDLVRLIPMCTSSLIGYIVKTYLEHSSDNKCLQCLRKMDQLHCSWNFGNIDFCADHSF